LADISIPNSVTEALEDPKWKEAMNEEMRALQKNVTWELVPLSHGKKTVVCMWIYTVKLKADGSVERYKVRLVANGFTKSMKNFGYTQSNSDYTMFLKRDEGKLTILIVYVDDIIVTENDAEEQLKLQKYLSQEFEMKDL
ncbi:PREDICTED: Retrovirus-related Pol poly from transposon, partial [Prunus dulcis]